jgi:hypothetical protein
MSKKIIKKKTKVKSKAKKPKNTKELPSGIGFGNGATSSNSVPLGKLSKEDQKIISWSSSPDIRIDDPKEKEEFEAALKANGQPTDAEIELKKSGFSIDLDKFALVVEEDKIPVEDMIKWVTSIITKGSCDNSFNSILEKFFKFRLNQLSLTELVVLRYNIDDAINKKAMPSKDICPGEDLRDEFKIG